ncbi:MAG: P-loop NTPase [Acidobacteria bacterium]|nr:P-loop NTPase [Acidobacteriota bacterium]
MNDQASTLRSMASARKPLAVQRTARNSRASRCIAVTGGKGGVGKSNFAVNLSLELGQLGNQVALLDADFGLANADLLCGVTPKYHLGHVVEGLKTLEEVTVPLSPEVELIPGGSGIEELANFSLSNRPQILEQMREMEEDLDYMVIDTAAGISDAVSGVLAAASEVVIVVTPEPTAIIDAYATIKVMLRRRPGADISVVVNNAVGVGDAENVFQSISTATREFLDHAVGFLGVIPADPNVTEAVRSQVPVTQHTPETPASRAIRLIAKDLHRKARNEATTETLNSFWERFGGN